MLCNYMSPYLTNRTDASAWYQVQGLTENPAVSSLHCASILSNSFDRACRSNALSDALAASGCVGLRAGGAEAGASNRTVACGGPPGWAAEAPVGGCKSAGVPGGAMGAKSLKSAFPAVFSILFFLDRNVILPGPVTLRLGGWRRGCGQGRLTDHLLGPSPR